jgi:hypothetical protein
VIYALHPEAALEHLEQIAYDEQNSYANHGLNAIAI